MITRVEKLACTRDGNSTIETPFWHLRPARLKGEIGYEYFAEGQGPFEGINVLWGHPRDGGPFGQRRFKVKWGSKPLWKRRSEGGDAYALARCTLDSLAGELWQRAPSDRECAIRRVDACLDHWGYKWTRFDLGRFAARASTRASDERTIVPEPDETPITTTNTYQGKISATYEVGSRGAASCFLRVYNKIVEARAKGKLTWMEPVWREYGWDGKTAVWRAEIECGGEWCQDHGLTTLDELHGIEHALWRDYFGRTRHTTSSATRNKRSPTSAVWLHLVDLVERDAKRASPAAWAWQPRAPRPAADNETLGDVGSGCFRKVGDRLFPGWDRDPEQEARLSVYIFELMRQSAKRAAEREARVARKLARAGPAPPEDERPPPKPRRVSQLVAKSIERGAELAAAHDAAFVPKYLRSPP